MIHLNETFSHAKFVTFYLTLVINSNEITYQNDIILKIEYDGISIICVYFNLTRHYELTYMKISVL